MSGQESMPPICYELVEAIHEHGGPMPYRSLPAHLRDTGLLKVCRHHRLIEIVLWYEPDRRATISTDPSIVVVEAPPGWLPYYSLGCSSIREAIERDADSADPRKGVHVALTGKGDMICETRRLEEAGSDLASGVRVEQNSPAGGYTERLARLKPSHRKAYLQRQCAQQHRSGLPPGQPGDRAAHDWLREHGDEEGEQPGALATWLRYLRAARHELGENNPRYGRPHGSSVASSDQL